MSGDGDRRRARRGAHGRRESLHTNGVPCLLQDLYVIKNSIYDIRTLRIVDELVYYTSADVCFNVEIVIKQTRIIIVFKHRNNKDICSKKKKRRRKKREIRNKIGKKKKETTKNMF